MIIDQIKKQMNFTNQEKSIQEYIINNPDEIMNLNAKELAKVTFTSSSTIIRFCKKLGFNGYPEFQKKYIFDYVINLNSKEYQIRKNASPQDTIKMVNNLYYLIIEETGNLVNKDVLNRIVNYLLRAKKIDFYASDINYARVQSMCIKLNSLGIQAQAFNTINQIYLKSIDPSDTVAFVITHTGSNKHMIDIAYELRKRRIRTMGISGTQSQDLTLICNETLYIYSQDETDFHTIYYGLSLEYILDLIHTNLYLKITNQID